MHCMPLICKIIYPSKSPVLKSRHAKFQSLIHWTKNIMSLSYLHGTNNNKCCCFVLTFWMKPNPPPGALKVESIFRFLTWTKDRKNWRLFNPLFWGLMIGNCTETLSKTLPRGSWTDVPTLPFLHHLFLLDRSPGLKTTHWRLHASHRCLPPLYLACLHPLKEDWYFILSLLRGGSPYFIRMQ